MSASSVLLVAATMVAADGVTATLDAGRTQHLEVGDRGSAFYELVVDGSPRRIEAGGVEVIAVDETSATVRSETGAPLRPGYRTELRLPVDRIPEVSSTVSSSPSTAPPVEPRPPSPPETSVPPPVAPPERSIEAAIEPLPEVEERAPEPVKTAAPALIEPAAPPDVSAGTSEIPKAVRAVPPRELVTVAAGTYAVGLDPAAAEFFDQTPRHEVELTAFVIDRQPVGAPPMTGLTFDQAQAFCGKLGMRLPTESEWEVAAQEEGFLLEAGIFEWTDSWYEAYPGNTRREEGYGESFRVLRGLADGSTDSVHTRRFMAPTNGNSMVGFRCARDGK